MKVPRKINWNDIGTVTIFSCLILGMFVVLPNWDNIQAYFASSPKGKCEARLEFKDRDVYCNDDGSKGSRLSDEGKVCLKWQNGYEGGKCNEFKFTTQEVCLMNKDSVPRTPDIEDGVSVKCLDDGSWKYGF